MKTRRHHNNKGLHQIKQGKTRIQVKAMAKRVKRLSNDSKSGKLIDSVNYFMRSESVHIINGLYQLLSEVLIALVQQREIIEGDETGPSLIVEQAARIEKLEVELAAMKRMAHIWTIKAAREGK